jgi:hypothetical protein
MVLLSWHRVAFGAFFVGCVIVHGRLRIISAAAFVRTVVIHKLCSSNMYSTARFKCPFFFSLSSNHLLGSRTDGMETFHLAE